VRRARAARTLGWTVVVITVAGLCVIFGELG
jgi:hypothetical protein